ncbi:MAG TPA: DNA methylase [Firmicutes bacterium]|nr:DNA methylase [Bacillota bacterium]
MNKIYASIDLKSFYASVECQERGLNPLTTNLVVADATRTEKTICLAVSPSLKQYGISGRARLYEVIQRVREVNKERKFKYKIKKFIGESYDDNELKDNPNLEVSYIIASPRMSYYMKYSTDIYNVYLKYIAPEDIYAYSIDEVFCDITKYIKLYKLSPEELITKMISDVYSKTGITATAGIGTNMYLCKIAMDILAKHALPNEYGVRIAFLDEMSYRRKLWNHKPITDFWRVGKGYAKRLEEYKIYTMGDVARTSLNNEDLLYKLFGVNAELLIDHSWGYEPVLMSDVKNYKSETKSISSGQVLKCPYDSEKARIIVKEMAEGISLDLVNKKYITDQLVLHIDYDIENLTDSIYKYNGEIVSDRYGRKVPKPAHGTFRLTIKTSSMKKITDGFLSLYDRIIDNNLLIRKINLCAANLEINDGVKEIVKGEQLSLFDNVDVNQSREEVKEEEMFQKVLINIRNKFGKNALLRGINLEEGATAKERNSQIGGHKA